jgi:hypothetical protein
MIPPSWTRQPLRAKRSGSKRFLPKSTNGTGNTQIESNCRISADPSLQGSMSEIAFHEKAGWSQVDSFLVW